MRHISPGVFKRSVLILFICMLPCISAAQQKNYKDRGEFEAYDAVAKDFDAKNFAKALADLDSWSKKYPESDFRNDRQLLLVQAYSRSNQPAKAIDVATSLTTGDLAAAFTRSADALTFLYTVSTDISRIPEPTDTQLAAASRAAQQLQGFDKIPEGVTPEAWTQTRAEVQKAAKAALLYVALVPVQRALKTNDCASAESAAMKSIASFPESVQAAWYLGEAELCLYKTQPAKASILLYEFARAAAIDAKAGMVDPNWQRSTVEPYLEKIFAQYHGADPAALHELKELAAKSPLPPDGFEIRSAAAIERDREEIFDRENPERALWAKLKQALSAPDGAQYFVSSMKDAEIPPLKGTLVVAMPDCKPTELLVAMQEGASEPLITLKLAKPLDGAPELNREIRWQGVPSAFTPLPFMLTVETEPAKITGLVASACAAPPRKPAPAKGR